MGHIGFIGLGIMGKPMAINLVLGGVSLKVYDLNQSAVAELVKVGATAATIEEIATQCDIIFSILPNGPIVKSVLLGEGGVATFAKKGTLLCDLSSISPKEAKEIGEALLKLELSFMDCPVSGGEPKAIDGTLAFMAGGAEADFEKVKPYFDIMGSAATLTGTVGSGCTTKLVNQIIVNMNIATLCEAFVLAAKAGCDPEKVFEAIRYGAAGSTMLDAKVPMIMERNFAPGGKVSINRKDIKNVIDTAHDLDIPVPFTAQLFEIMQSLKVAGQMDEDHCSIVKHFEKLAGVEVKR